MVIRFLYILLFSHILIPNVQAQKKGEAILMQGSKMSIAGNSNVNSFECKLEKELNERRIAFQFIERGRVIQFSETSLKVAVTNFNCGNRHITRDMHQTLKAAEFPLIEFELLAVDFNTKVMQVIISIAGMSKSFQLDFSLQEKTNDIFRIEVCQEFQMTDFGISPPKTMMGLIVVNDKINIALELYLDLDI